MTKIKYCGLKRIADLALAEELGIDYAGFVIVPSSRRFVSVKEIVAMQEWRQKTGARIQPVLVLMDLAQAEIVDVTNATGVHHVQLAGSESPELCRRLRDENRLTVWKSWHVAAASELNGFALQSAGPIDKYLRSVDAMLLDTSVLGSSGGTGVAFPWDLIPAYQKASGILPLVVAGGLTPENVGELVAAHHPGGVDVSSGIETDGQKDAKKMRSFAKSVREADHEA